MGGVVAGSCGDISYTSVFCGLPPGSLFEFQDISSSLSNLLPGFRVLVGRLALRVGRGHLRGGTANPAVFCPAATGSIGLLPRFTARWFSRTYVGKSQVDTCLPGMCRCVRVCARMRVGISGEGLHILVGNSQKLPVSITVLCDC